MITDKAVFGLPLPISHGCRDDGTYIRCGEPADHSRSFRFSGSPPEALALARALDAMPLIVRAFQAVHADCRDPDTHTCLAPATIKIVNEALQALGARASEAKKRGGKR